MKKIIVGLGLVMLGAFAHAQQGLERIIVEKFYVSNAADSVGSYGTLPVGSVTYRIYADMLPGYKFQMAYGNSKHSLSFSTSTSFFNNTDRGATTTNTGKNTVLLDSWLSVGAACSGYNGVLKSEDDGVSTLVNSNGLLKNTDASAGIPLTSQDGMIAGTINPVTFVGITPNVFNDGSSNGNSFSTNNGAWACQTGVNGQTPGASGPTAANRVLIAQITTNGIFHYELNIQIGTPTGGYQLFVAKNPTGNEISIPSLMGTGLTLAQGTTTQTSVQLNWTLATDTKKVKSYDVFKNGISVGSTTSQTFNVEGLIGDSTYNFTVNAKDSLGNFIATSTPFVGKTLGGVATGTKLAQTITFGALAAKTTLDLPFALTAYSSAKLPITYTSSDPTVATVTGNIVRILKAGVTSITASQIGNAKINAATDVKQILTISKVAQTITFGVLPTYTMADPSTFTLSATASSGLTVSYTSDNSAVASVSGNTVTIIGVGVAHITASQVGDNNFNAALNILQTLTVTGVPQTITFGTLPTYTTVDLPFNLVASANSGLPVSFISDNAAVATVSGNSVAIVGVGVAHITASQAGNTTFSAATNVLQTLTVTTPAIATKTNNKYNQTISFAALPTRTVVDLPFNLTAKSTSLLPISYSSDNTAVATVSGNTVTIVGAGIANITASQAGNAGFNAAINVIQKLTVTKLSQTITFATLPTKTMGDPSTFTLSGKSTSLLPISYVSDNSAVATVSGNIVTIVGAGIANITASQAGNGTFNAAINVIQKLTVNKLNQTILFGALPTSVSLGDSPFALAATSSSLLKVTYRSANTSIATISDSTLTIVGIGSDTIYAMQAGNSKYNAALSVFKVLTVKAATSAPAIVKGTQTINFVTPAKTVFDLPFALSGTSSSGLPVSYTTSAVLGSPITDPNTVATVDANGIVTIVGAGTINITATQSGNGDYLSATPVVKTFTVTKLAQVINFAALPIKNIVDVPFALSLTSTSGLPITYSTSAVYPVIDPNTVATVDANGIVTIVGAGTINIIASQAGNNNYLPATSVTKTLTVNKLSQTIKVTASGATVRGQINLTTTINSGLIVAYTNSDATTATFDATTGIVTFLQPGIVTITASQAGNDIYTPAISVSVMLTYTGTIPPSATFLNTTTGIADVSNKGINVSVYPNPATSFIFVEASENSTVQLFDLNGKQIYSKTNVIANQKEELNVQNLAEGIYFIKVYNDKFSTVKKVVINK